MYRAVMYGIGSRATTVTVMKILNELILNTAKEGRKYR